jgi:Uma2 family endonuclease
MRTIVVGERPQALVELMAARAAKGHDRFDEVWEGEYHLAPAPHSRHGVVDRQLASILDPIARSVGLVPLGPFNLGSANDYRVPAAGYTRTTPTETFVPSAVIVVEIVSPGDETFDKFEFYAGHSVEEIVIVNPLGRSVSLFAAVDAAVDAVFRPADRSQRLGLASDELASQIDWPS